MPSSPPALDLLPLLPISLPSLLSFLSTSLATALTTASTNDFFAYESSAAAPGGSGIKGKGKVALQRGEEGCWDRLPEEWRDYFEDVKEEDREKLLRDLADGRWDHPDFPPSLQHYLQSCLTLALPRTCSTTPILSYPPSASSSATTPTPAPSPAPPPIKPGKGKGSLSNAARAGQSPKKAHEVEKMSELVGQILEEQEGRKGRTTHAIDVGSGRAHLSRALTQPPLSLHVLAVDWSATQISGAEYLDSLKSRSPSPSTSAQGEGSLTHQTSSLDADAIAALMKRWPPSADAAEDKIEQPSMLLALHACGDLTLSALAAFLSTTTSTSPASCHRAAILVGCCYNLQTPSLFPSSLTVSSPSSPSPRLALTRAHLLLTAQSPSLWYSPLTPLSYPLPSSLPLGHALRSSIRKLAYRARLEVELVSSGVGGGKGVVGERRVGRVGECEGWNEYRTKALARYSVAGEEVPELEMDGGEAGWEEALWKLQVFWTLRSWLGPLLEGALVLDRWCRLVEGLAVQGEWDGDVKAGGVGEGAGDEYEDGTEKRNKRKGRRVELINLFDQRTGSLRNLALVVR